VVGEGEVAEISVVDNSTAQRYEALLGEEVAGFLNYRKRPGGIEMIHTQVAPRFEGHGVGSVLVEFALEDVAKKGLTLVPTCPFVARYIRTHPRFQSLVATH